MSSRALPQGYMEGREDNFGFLTSRQISTTTAVKTVSATPANVFGLEVRNFGATAASIKFFDVGSSSITVGTTTPLVDYVCEGSATNGKHGTLYLRPDFVPLFAGTSAINYYVTAGQDDNGGTAPAGSVTVRVIYKK